MGLYKIGPGRGRPLGGGYRPQWADYYGDERASLIKFGMADTPAENETLRRARCEAGHIFSVTERSCPWCAMERVEARQRAEAEKTAARLRADIEVLRKTPGHCTQCGAHLKRKRGKQGGPKRYCDRLCLDRAYRERTKGES